MYPHHAYCSSLPKLFHRAFSLRFDRLPREQAGREKLIFQITDPAKLERIISQFGYEAKQTLALHINFAVVEEECCRASFFRGAFLAGGSVTDPRKGYHLELATSHRGVSREVPVLLAEMEFQPKSAQRKGNAITYFKQSEHIEDFLIAIGAPLTAMEVMNAKLEKSLRGGVNRRVNCDAANLDKAVEAAQSQLEAIRRLQEDGRLNSLPDKLKQAAVLRLENPEDTLSQLAELFDPPITKSALNHRLRKLIELAKERV